MFKLIIMLTIGIITFTVNIYKLINIVVYSLLVTNNYCPYIYFIALLEIFIYNSCVEIFFRAIS